MKQSSVMEQPNFDPGLTQKFSGTLRRAINKDGSFNVHRTGTTWRDVHPYLFLINTNWWNFFFLMFAGYIVMNSLFALVYYSLGPDQLQGADSPTEWAHFLNSFFFSAHTLTTVGYGSISPKGTAANVVAAIEAMVGLMGFALATGLLYGRVSRPSAKIGYSSNLLITPYQDITSLQFRVVNQRENILMELDAIVTLMTVVGPPGNLRREFSTLRLERRTVYFLPLTWTIVHPIDTHSPLYGKTHDDLAQLQAEVLVLIKGFDDTFSQTVHSRYSYRYDEIVWGARFTPAFNIDPEGDIVLEVDKVGALAAADASKA
ncbi:MAG TPA: ion channel [Bryobacteraceae bacterium]|nr:ion channel [Bryobacteraceae bacterium]